MIKNDIVYEKCNNCVSAHCIHKQYDLKVVGCICGAEQIEIKEEEIDNNAS